MRLAGCLLVLSLASFAAADRLITIPVGIKIPYRVVRGEFLWEPSRRQTTYKYLGLGIGTSLDMEVRTEQWGDEEERATFDLGFNISAPLPDLTPGISVGFLDAINETEAGRRAYLAITLRTAVAGNVAPGTSIETTIGATFGSNNNAFFGANVPFTDQFRFMVEHNGDQINTGFEYRFRENVAARLLFEPGRTFLTVRYSTKF